MKVTRNENLFTYFALFLIAFLVVICSSYCPFFFRKMHVDSSVYITIADGMSRGLLPYKDFADNKGPILYLISVPGFLIGRFTGVWITEIFLMCVSVFFAYKTALFFAKKHIALLATACSFTAFLAFFTAAGGAEEYSLPFVMISFYIFTKRFYSKYSSTKFWEIIILGACFAITIIIRLNHFPFWLGFCLVIIVQTIIKRDFLILCKYITGFCLGIILILIPIYLYLHINGIFNGFVNNVIISGTKRGVSGLELKQLVKNIYVMINRFCGFIPLVVGAFFCFTRFGKNEFTYYLACFFSYLLSVFFLSFTGGRTNEMLTPFMIPCITICITLLYPKFANIKCKRIAFALFLCIVFSEGLLKFIDDTTETIKNKTGRELINAGKMIDENTKDGDTIISLGINGYIYPFTQRKAASKYIYQGSGTDYFFGAREEFLKAVLQNKPAIIACLKGEYRHIQSWYNPIFDMIDSEYRLLSDDNGYTLFIKNES